MYRICRKIKVRYCNFWIIFLAFDIKHILDAIVNWIHVHLNFSSQSDPDNAMLTYGNSITYHPI